MEPIHDRSETDISDYLMILKRRWFVLVGTALLVVGAVAAMDFTKTPIYQASAQLLLQSRQSESIFSPVPAAGDPARAVQNELNVINSLEVRRAVEKSYGAPISISATSGGEDDIIILSATDTNPKVAARKVNVYAAEYQRVRLDAILSDIVKSKKVLQQQIDDFQQEIDEINKPLAAIDAELVTMPSTDPAYADLVSRRQRVESEVQAQRNDKEEQLHDYQQRLQVLQLSERLTTTGGVQILNPATVPTAPISPNLVRDLLQAALVGLFLGVGLTFLLEQVDDSIRTTGDLERATKPLPILGLIPNDPDWKDKNLPRTTTQIAPMSATAEAYRGLRTTLQYLALHRQMGVVQVTSAKATEGKSSTIANLAFAFAEAGMSVAVVGCDLRRPRLHGFFDVDGSIGLTSVLLGEVSLEDAFQASPIHPAIHVLPSGPRPPNPSELLSLNRTMTLIESLTRSHTIVFLDCPPVLPVTDSLVLSRCVDATLLVVQARRTSRREVKRSIERLHQVDSPLIGTIFNGVNAETAYGSLYEYYGYAESDQRSIGSRFFKRKGTEIPALSDASLPIEPVDSQHDAAAEHLNGIFDPNAWDPPQSSDPASMRP